MSWIFTKKRWQNLLEKPESRGDKIGESILQGFIILSLISFSIETLPHLSEKTVRLLKIIEVITVFVFTLEYGARIWISQKKIRFIFSFLGLVDLMAILPFYLSLGIDLRSLRIVRLLRIFRAIKLLRYGKAIHRFRHALLIAREEFILFYSVAMLIFYIASVGIYYFENNAQPQAFQSIFHSLWWSVTTLTTVGYGDIYPITVGGKIFTFVILMIGLGIVAIPAGLMASALSEARRLENQDPETLADRENQE